jgi:hypothetical protein
MYESLILVDNASQITTRQLLDELRSFYANDPHAPADLFASSATITLRWPDYVLQVAREELPHVIEESAEIASRFGNAHPNQQRIAACRCRFSTSGDNDPDMMHFNDYLFVGEALERLGVVYRFDQSTAEFMYTGQSWLCHTEA